MLICPVCGSPLNKQEHTFSCESGHSFDISSSGYCNLLIKNKSGEFIGDNKSMVAARRSFLDSGAYLPLCESVCRLACSLLQNAPCCAVVDSGCGEGYYTRAVAQALSGKKLSMVGIDISKSATQYAAKRDKLTTYITASSFHMPVAGESADLVLSLFSPSAPLEFKRILKPGGKIIKVVPGAEHLWELKEVVYSRPYLNREDKHHIDGFSLAGSQSVKYTLDINSQEQLQALFSMTPYCHRTPKDGIERLNKLNGLKLTMSFLILIFEKDKTDT